MTNRRIPWSILLCGFAGCAEILDIPDDLKVREAPQCVVQTATKDTAQVRLAACDYIRCGVDGTTWMTPLDLVASICDRYDTECVRPIKQGLRPVNGLFEFEVPTSIMPGVRTGFDGYVKIESAAHTCKADAAIASSMCPQTVCAQNDPTGVCQLPSYVPSLVFANPPVVTDSFEPMFVLPMMPPAQYTTFLQAAGVSTVDFGLGGILVSAVDGCTMQPVAGVEFELAQPQPDAIRLYVTGSTRIGDVTKNGFPSTAASATDVSGIGGYNNVTPSRNLTIRAKSATDASYVGEASIGVRPFTLSHARIVMRRPEIR